MKDLFHWVALAMAPGVGSVLYKRLTQTLGSPAEVFRAPLKALRQIEGIGPQVAASIKKFDWQPMVEKELRLSEKNGIKLVTWEDMEYPGNLKPIYDPPPLLYVRGSLMPQDAIAVAMVGSRYPTTYGQLAAERISSGLSRKGVTVVSGLARGVDSFAHRGALVGGGRTIGVLGCGADIIYPPENRDLFEQVAAQGAVVSEFPLGTPPDSDHFPIRNRIISGLSLGVAVVEATLRSGSLITARFALDQGRDVYAVPGNVDSARSEGTNRLIKEGARLVTRAEDILEEIHHIPRPAIPETPAPPKLSEEESKVYRTLENQVLHIDQIIAHTVLPSSKVSAILLALELAGHVKQLPGMRFAKA